jgi:hypothetical protein
MIDPPSGIPGPCSPPDEVELPESLHAASPRVEVITAESINILPGLVCFIFSVLLAVPFCFVGSHIDLFLST